MLIILFIFIIGLIIGSFLNVVIWRLHSNESIISGRSQCSQCKTKLKAKDLVPLVSFIVLRGKCRYCQKPISWQYPLVELATGLLFVLVYLVNLQLPVIGLQSSDIFFAPAATPTQLLKFFRDIFLVSVLTIIFVYDLRWQLIPDQVTIPSIVLLFVFSLLLGQSLGSLVFAVLVGFGFFGLQYWVSSGRWIGGGDLRLGALMGAALGWPLLIVGLLAAYIVGAAVSVVLLVSGKAQAKTPIAFGTFLALGTLVALFWGEKIINWYFGLLS
ncbi:MAG: prepilin peptidase [Candidatus Buchananbacteria bacterium]